MWTEQDDVFVVVIGDLHQVCHFLVRQFRLFKARPQKLRSIRRYDSSGYQLTTGLLLLIEQRADRRRSESFPYSEFSRHTLRINPIGTLLFLNLLNNCFFITKEIFILMLSSIINYHPHTSLQGTITVWVQFLIGQQHKFWVLQTLNLGFWNLEFGIADQGTLTTF